MDDTDDLDGAFLVEPIRRTKALQRLSQGPAKREELSDELDVSKATLHRVVKGFADAGFVRETDAGVELTGAGREAAAAVERYRDRMAAVERLEPLLNGLPTSLEFELEWFADAEVVTPTAGHPQRPVQRVVDFLKAASSLRATSAVVLPIYVEVLSREIDDGMETELVVASAVIETLRTEYPERFAEALETGTLELYVHDAIEVGLAIDDGRALVVGAREGVTEVVVVTDRPAAIDWIETVYEQYRETGEPYDFNL